MKFLTSASVDPLFLESNLKMNPAVMKLKSKQFRLFSHIKLNIVKKSGG